MTIEFDKIVDVKFIICVLEVIEDQAHYLNQVYTLEVI